MKITLNDPDGHTRWRIARGVPRSPRTPRRRSTSIPSPNAIQLPAGLYLGEVGGRRHQFARATSSSTRAPGIRPSPSAPCGRSRTAARGCSSSIARASTCGKSARIPTDLCCRPGARRSGRQYLGG